jgi:hypothetical protein
VRRRVIMIRVRSNLSAAALMGIIALGWSANGWSAETRTEQKIGATDGAAGVEQEEIYYSEYSSKAQECKGMQKTERRACLKNARRAAAKAARMIK